MSFSGDLDNAIIDKVSDEYQKASSWLPFAAIEIQKVFNDAQLEELSQFVSEVQSAGASNNRKAEAIEKHSKIVLKLLKMAKVVV